MAQLTRQRFIKQVSAGAAAIGALAVAPGLTVARAAGSTAAPTLHAAHEPLVAYVRDAAKGEITMMIGTREVTVHDPALVQRLLHAVR